MPLHRTPRRHRRLAVAGAMILVGHLSTSAARADDVVLSGMSWMTAYPATWNAAAPKLVFDGLHTYAVLCGYQGAMDACSVARRRGAEPWTHPGRVFRSNQPPVMIIDRRGRLNIFYNYSTVRHLRFDNPSVDLVNGIELPLGVTVGVGYLHASYDPATDSIFLAGNETSTWTLYVSVNAGGAGWSPPAAMPGPDPGSMYLYARTLYARGHYYVLTGEHPRTASNASYTAAVVFESPTPTGPWRAHDVFRATGANIGVPYENWTVPIDLQADLAGRVRILLHIVEDGSGHPSRPEGLHIAREEDGFVLRHVGGGIDDGFALQIHPSGVHLAFALIRSDPIYQEAGHLVVFRSDDGGASWQPPRAIVTASALNPSPLDRRSGSMSWPSSVPFIYSAPLLPPYEQVLSSEVVLGAPSASAGTDTSYVRADGARVRVRTHSETATTRSYRLEEVVAADGSVTISYRYATREYSQDYTIDSKGAFQYRTSDGFEASSRGRR